MPDLKGGNAAAKSGMRGMGPAPAPDPMSAPPASPDAGGVPCPACGAMLSLGVAPPPDSGAPPEAGM